MMFDRLFRQAPVKKGAKCDPDRVVMVEHRVGRVLYFTKVQLVKRTGAEKDWSEFIRSVQRKTVSKEELLRITNDSWKSTCESVMRLWNSYVRYLSGFYEQQNGLIRACGIPVDKDGTIGYFIQAIVDRDTKGLMVGDADDLADWNDVNAIREKPHVNKYADVIQSAKSLQRLPGVNKDIQHRSKLLVSGEHASQVNMVGYVPGEKKKA
jgi:hypothetical protein